MFKFVHKIFILTAVKLIVFRRMVPQKHERSRGEPENPGGFCRRIR